MYKFLTINAKQDITWMLYFLGTGLPLYTSMWVCGWVRIRQMSTQPLLRPGWRQVSVHVYALPSTALQWFLWRVEYTHISFDYLSGTILSLIFKSLAISSWPGWSWNHLLLSQPNSTSTQAGSEKVISWTTRPPTTPVKLIGHSQAT